MGVMVGILLSAGGSVLVDVISVAEQPVMDEQVVWVDVRSAGGDIIFRVAIEREAYSDGFS